MSSGNAAREAGQARLAAALLVCAGLLLARAAGLPAGSQQAAAQPAEAYEWRRLALPADAASFATRGRDGTVWLRYLDADKDQLQAFTPKGQPVLSGSTEAIIEARYLQILSEGSIAELWSTESAGRIWLGPRYFDGRSWRRVASDSSSQGVSRTWGPESTIDAQGRIWIPFRITRDCPQSGTCVDSGLQAFGARGALEGELRSFEPQLEADRFGLRDVYLPGMDGAGGEAPALARRHYHALSRAESTIDYPMLGPPEEPTDLRNAGYLTAATLDAEGLPQAFLWIEEQLPDRVEHRLISVHRTAAGEWGDIEDLTAGPLFEDDPARRRLVAADWRPEGDGYWCASSAGDIAFRMSDSSWGRSFTREQIGLHEDAYIRDLAAGAEGRLFLVTDQGVWFYGEPVDSWSIHLPVLTRGR